MNSILGIGIPVLVAIVIAVIFTIVVFKSCYKICLPNEVMVITGPRGSKNIIGKACFIIPFLQTVKKME